MPHTTTEINTSPPLATNQFAISLYSFTLHSALPCTQSLAKWLLTCPPLGWWSFIHTLGVSVNGCDRHTKFLTVLNQLQSDTTIDRPTFVIGFRQERLPVCSKTITRCAPVLLISTTAKYLLIIMQSFPILLCTLRNTQWGCLHFECMP